MDLRKAGRRAALFSGSAKQADATQHTSALPNHQTFSSTALCSKLLTLLQLTADAGRGHFSGGAGVGGVGIVHRNARSTATGAVEQGKCKRQPWEQKPWVHLAALKCSSPSQQFGEAWGLGGDANNMAACMNHAIAGQVRKPNQAKASHLQQQPALLSTHGAAGVWKSSLLEMGLLVLSALSA